jgi:hypothetical protein
MIVALSELLTSDILTPSGKELSIDYLGYTFLPIYVYKSLQEAILACRQDLEAGLLSIVVTEAKRFSVWWHLPELRSLE